MFGISFVELLVVALVMLFVIRPKDAPQIARNLGRVYAKIRNSFEDFKQNIDNVKAESGFSQVKEQFDEAVNEIQLEKQEKQQKVTKIVDLYGETHYVPDIQSIRPDLDQEQLQAEVSQENQKNSRKDQ